MWWLSVESLWVVVTSSLLVNLLEHGRIRFMLAGYLKESTAPFSSDKTDSELLQLEEGTHFWIACSKSYSRAVCFVFWLPSQPESLRGRPCSRYTVCVWKRTRVRESLSWIRLLKIPQAETKTQTEGLDFKDQDEIWKKISTEDQDTDAEDQMWVKSSEEQN